MDILTDGLIKCGLPQEACAPLAEKMEAYIKEIVLFNSAYNLTNTSDHDELVTRHILDSLAAYGEIAQLAGKIAGSSPTMTGAEGTAGADSAGDGLAGDPAGAQLTFADIGSGGGLPGIPLAAAFMLAGLPVQWQLVERMEKRCAFLENCAAILGLKNVTVVNSEAERLPPESYDLITFRAFRPLDKKMTKTLLRIVRPSGHLCAYKAKLSSIQEEMGGIKSQVPDYRIAPLSVPGLEDSERNLVIITKPEIKNQAM